MYATLLVRDHARAMPVPVSVPVPVPVPVPAPVPMPLPVPVPMPVPCPYMSEWVLFLFLLVDNDGNLHLYRCLRTIALRIICCFYALCLNSLNKRGKRSFTLWLTAKTRTGIANLARPNRIIFAFVLVSAHAHACARDRAHARDRARARAMTIPVPVHVPVNFELYVINVFQVDAVFVIYLLSPR